MPRTDREDARKILWRELTLCSFSKEDADRWIERFSEENLTANDVMRIEELVFEIRRRFEALKENLNHQLQSEQSARELLLDQIKKFVGDSIEGLRKFETQAEPSDNADNFMITEEDLAVLETLSRSPDSPS